LQKKTRCPEQEDEEPLTKFLEKKAQERRCGQARTRCREETQDMLERPEGR
jgi:hypothetical protein